MKFLGNCLKLFHKSIPKDDFRAFSGCDVCDENEVKFSAFFVENRKVIECFLEISDFCFRFEFWCHWNQRLKYTDGHLVEYFVEFGKKTGKTVTRCVQTSLLSFWGFQSSSNGSERTQNGFGKFDQRKPENLLSKFKKLHFFQTNKKFLNKNSWNFLLRKNFSWDSINFSPTAKFSSSL